MWSSSLLASWLQQWRAARSDERRRVAAAKFNEGYAYARACLLSGIPEHELHLHAMLEDPYRRARFKDFDRGIRRAMKEHPII